MKEIVNIIKSFNIGDIIVITDSDNFSYITFNNHNVNDGKYISSGLNCFTNKVFTNSNICSLNNISNIRLANDDEQTTLFNAIRKNGYRYNNKSKTLELSTTPLTDVYDIHNIKPFDKVLVRNVNYGKWTVDLFSYISDDNLTIKCVGGNYDANFNVVIPYNNETKYLVGIEEECPEYYRYWI